MTDHKDELPGMLIWVVLWVLSMVALWVTVC